MRSPPKYRSLTPSRPHLPVALTIAGSDSGGGAGIQADLKVFHSLKTHGTSAITCLTAQNPAAVTAVHAAPPAFLLAQLDAIFSELRPHALKTGMLFSAPLVQSLAQFLSAQKKRVPFVLDPVMVSTSGAQLLKPNAVRAVTQRLFPLASLITPNLDEAQLLLGISIRSLADLRDAAHFAHHQWQVPVLLKGGHLQKEKFATDIFYDGTREIILRAPFARNVSTHGTGCTYSAAITAHLAHGKPLPTAVRLSKKFITRAIHNSARIRSHWVLQS